MRTSQLFAVALSFVAACETKAPPDDPGSSREGLAAQIKAQTSAGVDGGAAVRAAAAALTVQPPTIVYTATGTTTGTGTGTMTWVGSIVTTTTTGTATKTDVQTATATKTVSAGGVVTATFTGTKTGVWTSTGSKTAIGTATWIATYRGTGTATGTKTLSGTQTLTGTVTLTGSLSVSATSTKSATGTKSVTGTAVGTGSKTVSQTYTAAPTTTKTSTLTTTGMNTAIVTRTGIATATSTTTVTNPCYGTWAFCDNFENGNGSGWNVQQGPVQNFAVIGDGTKVYRENDASASQIYISRAQVGMAWMDSTVEASLKPLSFSSSSATVSLWGRYDATWNADCGYYVSLRGDGKVALGKRVLGVSTALGSPVAVPGGIATGTWYDVKLDIQGTTLKAYVNNTQLLTQIDSSCTSGSVGVGSTGASFESDDVRVTAPATNACVQGWAGTQCGAFCTYEATVQSDRAGCGAYLDCYVTHGCSPETCGGQDDVCGVNVLNPWGTASKEVADQVYKCLGCAGSVNCANPKYYNGTVCADGSPCTWGDTCQNKVCVPDPNRNTQCYAADQCHIVGSCDTTSGACSNPTRPNGTECDDGDANTQMDSCQNGICTGYDVPIAQLTCVIPPDATNRWTAVFGYSNPGAVNLNVPADNSNNWAGETVGGNTQFKVPEWFRADGDPAALVAQSTSGYEVTWKLLGRTVTAASSSAPTCVTKETTLGTVIMLAQKEYIIARNYGGTVARDSTLPSDNDGSGGGGLRLQHQGRASLGPRPDGRIHLVRFA